jgi:hypothetical protein
VAVACASKPPTTPEPPQSDVYWDKPEATPQDFAQDRSACMSAADFGGPMMRAADRDTREAFANNFALCMNGKGWHLQEGPTQSGIQ